MSGGFIDPDRPLRQLSGRVHALETKVAALERQRSLTDQLLASLMLSELEQNLVVLNAVSALIGNHLESTSAVVNERIRSTQAVLDQARQVRSAT